MSDLESIGIGADHPFLDQLKVLVAQYGPVVIQFFMAYLLSLLPKPPAPVPAPEPPAPAA